MPKLPNQLRIIAGKYRGRKISFPAIDGLRPTPDRVRETLFNWLQCDIHDAVCLDLFAGSGALGLEALSRGARKVYFIDQNKDVIQSLQKITLELFPNQAKIIKAEFPFDLKLLNISPNSIDIIFLDPPFHKGWIMPCLECLEESTLLKPSALIYLETEKEFNLPENSNYHVLKEKKAGQVIYRLLQREAH